MQRHRKYLVITIWISTIAFIGAGFVGWGQYNYGTKSGAIAKVGDVSITQRELQQTYSRLFNSYSKLFQGKFDQEQAKKFGLDKQALRQLVNEALLINLANSYNLEATDREVAEVLQSQEAFYENGVFSKTLYQKLLKQNRLTAAEYEADLRKSLLVRKVLSLFEPKADALEEEAFRTALGIADKVEYKILTGDMVTVDTSDANLKAFWETRKSEYLTPQAFRVEYITQTPAASGADESALRDYFESHKHDFTGPDGKLLPFEAAKSAVAAALDDKETNKAALRTYITYKKGKLDEGVKVETATLTADDATFSAETMKAIASLDAAQPFLKPKKEGDRYVIIKLVESIAPQPKSFEAAKAEIAADYTRQMRSQKLMEMANSEVETFKGKTTDAYLTRQSMSGIDGLDEAETRELLESLFGSNRARGAAALKSDKTVLYHIVDQKIVPEEDPKIGQAVLQSKNALLNAGLIKQLDRRYETQIFVEGLSL